MSMQFSPVLFLKRKLGLRRWIEEVLGEPIDPSTDLAIALQNGAIICRVMLAAREGSIPKIHTNTTLQFKIRENIMFFLHACEEIGIPRYKIFSIPDLIENKNFFKVLECLEELAIIAENDHTVSAVLKVVTEDITFPDEEIRQADTLLKSIGMHQLKNAPEALIRRKSSSHSPSQSSLRKSVPLPSQRSSTSLSVPLPPPTSHHSPTYHTPISPTSHTTPTSPTSHVPLSTPHHLPLRSSAPAAPSAPISKIPATTHSRRALNAAPDYNKTNRRLQIQLEITPQLLNHTKAWVKLQALMRGHLARRLFQKRVRNAAYRHNVAKEILSTERIFVKKLSILVKEFLEPLREASISGKIAIKPEQIKSIFSDVEVILGYNTHLLKDLEPRVTNWSPNQRLGDIFMAITLFLKVYTQYVKDYTSAMATLNLCKENPKFAQFIRDCECSSESNGQDICSYLILPVQRIPRYSLLLADLVKHTWADHRDYADLCGALKKVQEVASYVNEKKREAENISRVLEIQNNFTGKFENLAEPHRRFVKEGQLLVGGDDTTVTRTFYLFNDLLVGTKPVPSGIFQKKELQKVKEFIKLANVDFNEHIPPDKTDKADKKEDKHDKSDKTPDKSDKAEPSSSRHSTSSSPPSTPTTTPTNPSFPNSPFASPAASPLTTPNGSDSPVPIHYSHGTDKISIPQTPQGAEIEFGFEFVDYSNRTAYRLFAKTAEEKESWLTEIRAIKTDLDAKRKLAEQSSLRKAQERAQLARDALGQQYATLRIKGRRFDANTVKQMEDEDTASTGSAGSVPDSPESTRATSDDESNGKMRDHAKLRRHTQGTGNGRSPSPPKPRRSAVIPFKSKDDSAAAVALAEEKKEKRGSWFNSLRKKKKTSLAEALGQQLEIDTTIDSNVGVRAEGGASPASHPDPSE